MESKENKETIFLPIYVDKNKLLDINSILFDGYSQFSETKLESENSNRKEKSANVNAGVGISIFKIGSDLEENCDSSAINKETTSLKRVQTTSSLLSNTINILRNKKILNPNDNKVGCFIEVTGTFKNNSICDLLDQLNEVVAFGELAGKLSKNINTSDCKIGKETLSQLKKIIKKRNDSERELVYETDDYIYVIHILLDSIYNSSIDNIYNNELTYFGQIKNITNNYKFFSDTQLSKFNRNSLAPLIDAIDALIKTDEYTVDFELLKESNGKKTIEIDIVAIYRKYN